MLDNNDDGLLKVTLIDYGYAKRIAETRDQMVNDFEGNLLFASST